MDTLATVKYIAAIVLMGAGAMLIIRVSHTLRCFARNLEKSQGVPPMPSPRLGRHRKASKKLMKVRKALMA